MFALDGVLLDERLAVAEVAALPQARVKRLQALGCLPNEDDERHVANLRANVKPDLCLVRHARGGVDLVLVHPAVQQRTDRGASTRDPQVVGVSQQARTEFLGLLLCRSLGANVAWLLDRDAVCEDDALARAVRMTRSPVLGSSPADTRT
ncbi:MAG: hypothetical protein EKK42_33470 [Pseudonocardiaceae bacterium]|nr:MAG: hypothetical protein EKK42_33470 [Pseudonocardiaceae bacterium]